MKLWKMTVPTTEPSKVCYEAMTLFKYDTVSGGVYRSFLRTEDEYILHRHLAYCDEGNIFPLLTS